MRDGIVYSDEDSEDEDEEKTALGLPAINGSPDRKQNDPADGSRDAPDGPQPLAGGEERLSCRHLSNFSDLSRPV